MSPNNSNDNITASEISIAEKKITSEKLANMLLLEGPMPIRAIVKGLIKDIPLVKEFSPSKQRRVIMRIMAKGDISRSIIFKKVGWGQWSAKEVPKSEFETQRALTNDFNSNFIESSLHKKSYTQTFDSNDVDENALTSDNEDDDSDINDNLRLARINHHMKRSRRYSISLKSRSRVNSITEEPQFINSRVNKHSTFLLGANAKRRKSSVVLTSPHWRNNFNFNQSNNKLNSDSTLVSDNEILNNDNDSDTVSREEKNYTHQPRYLPKLKPIPIGNNFSFVPKTIPSYNLETNSFTYDSISNSPVTDIMSNQIHSSTNHYIITHGNSPQKRQNSTSNDAINESSVRSTLDPLGNGATVETSSASETEDEDWESIGALSLRSSSYTLLSKQSQRRPSRPLHNSHDDTNVAALLLSLKS
ncbi:similar to Saccharomyces cerevisiae YDR169C STB3 Ribosomal RNA processing element (RRPE)-binding protein involved in the glucose-induced transition from quiescence to growth [Maudiozyma saulgeensis]|uniref:Similar to Saccharomyces cerevisiae YDR169C STB3 Ribosomal RNA processing element (RRPE)-binding protein involved in the glucose-induced transition from quiescence to growth n=1 Tax=Maudiozyma saulgeensis TaxID=1789683 RepID=A0A1X7R5W8_9SACH|nr:similar to Saccharomyces cerevisiae YDR169C STB3 Ribosomal RNA processing element (RRPE)-binding protein involved in the glucose-induced transition from quiescence to growth [Kazachstania saulgeensis]